ncbi:response regulator [Candidatus Avelusimicrobium aviculae]|uniref:response regulator n=1 Tax=Candidatus Avelusimicrobium aviculae TaxID=3416206 RepID=UPI003D148A34
MKKRVLIIEDETSIVELLMLVLMREGYEVKSCQSGREAVAMIKEFHPNLILLDVMLPGMDGVSIIKVLNEDEQLGSIPVIITSALVESQKMFEGFPQVKDFCAKPFVLKDLVVKVKQAIGDF